MSIYIIIIINTDRHAYVCVSEHKPALRSEYQNDGNQSSDIHT